MSHEANGIVDGFYEIRQEMSTKRVFLLKYGETVRTIQPGKILTMEELHEMLMKERTEMFMEGV